MALARRGIHRESTYDYNSTKSKRIRKWLKDAGLHIAMEPKCDSCWHIGKDKDQVILSTKILHKYDYENEVKTGTLFGFPKAAVEAYAHSRVSEEAMNLMMNIGKHRSDYPELKGKYFLPYMLYNIPKTNIIENSQTAKLWADTIRKDVPMLANWFEKKESLRDQH